MSVPTTRCPRSPSRAARMTSSAVRPWLAAESRYWPYGPCPVEWYRCASASRAACCASGVRRVWSRARRRSRHRLIHWASLVFTILTFPCLMEEPWRARLAASLLCLPIPVCDARRRQRAGTVEVSSVRPRSETDRIVNAAKYLGGGGVRHSSKRPITRQAGAVPRCQSGGRGST